MTGSGTPLTMAVPGLVSAFEFEGTPGVDDVASRPFRWLHFSLLNRQSHAWIRANLKLDDRAVDFFLSVSEHPHIELIGDHVCGSIPDFSQAFDAETDDSVRLTFILGPDLVLSGRHQPVQSAEALRERIVAGLEIATPDDLLSQLLRYFADRVDAIAERLSDEIEVIEDRVLASRPIDDRAKIAPVRQLAARQQRLVHSYRRAIIRYLRDAPNNRATGALSPLADQLEQVEGEFAEISARSRLLNEEMNSILAGETNRILFVLSALTAIFLPATFVVGFFGMNFSWIPFLQEPGGVWIGIVLCILSSAGVWVFLRWIQRGR